MSIPLLVARLTELDGLLRRQIGDDETVDTGGLAVLNELLLPIHEHRVVVAHEQDRDLESLVARLANDIESSRDGNTVAERNLYQC